MARKGMAWVGFQLTEAEKLILQTYCEQEKLTQTDVLRQLVRSLKVQIAMPTAQELKATKR